MFSRSEYYYQSVGSDMADQIDRTTKIKIFNNFHQYGIGTRIVYYYSIVIYEYTGFVFLLNFVIR